MHIEPEKTYFDSGVWQRIPNLFLHVTHLINRNQNAASRGKNSSAVHNKRTLEGKKSCLPRK
jgi:hypothetical protein